MSHHCAIHPTHPQPRVIKRAVEVLRDGGVIAYPTDSCYALGCAIANKDAMERIRRIRQLGDRHNLTLMCRDLSELSSYAKVDNSAFRLLRSGTPGPYTFILKATREVPRRLQNPRRKTIGLRVPNHPVARMLLEQLGEPLMSTTLIMPDETLPLVDAESIMARLDSRIDLILDCGNRGIEPSTVIDLTEAPPRVMRVGRGDPALING